MPKKRLQRTEGPAGACALGGEFQGRGAASTMSTEGAIEDRIIRDRGVLGYPGADVIRRCRVGRYVGVVDLVLIPSEGPRRLVLVEVKGGNNVEGHAKVIGQLLLYFTGALKIGTNGLDLMRDFARARSEVALRESMTSLKMLSGGVMPPDAAWAALRAGERIAPDQIHLCIGLDREPSSQLQETVALVRGHGLPMDVVIASEAGPTHIWAGPGNSLGSN